MSDMKGHNEPCYYCGKPCSNLAGDPGEWPIPLCHEDEPGVVKWHHIRCVSGRLTLAEELARALHDQYQLTGLLSSMVRCGESHSVESESQLLKVSGQTVAALTRAKEKGPMNGGWQPIETAPKDGDKILIWHPAWQWQIAMWDKGCTNWRITLGDLIKPTHWRPLPSAPQEPGS